MVEKVLEAAAPSSPEGAEAPETAPAPEPRRAPPTGRIWAGVGVVLAAAFGATWLFRMPLADAFLRWRLADMGLESDFAIVALDFRRAEIVQLRLGPEEEPTLSAARIEAVFAWSGLVPRLDGVHLIEPRLRGRWTEDGLSFGTLFQPSPVPRPRAHIPAMALTIEDGALLMDTPFGAMPFTIEGTGRLGADFRGRAEMTPRTLAAAGYRLEDGAVVLALASDAHGVTADLTGAARALRWGEWSGAGLRLSAHVSGPLSLEAIRANADLAAAALAGPDVAGTRLSLLAEGDATMAPMGFAPAQWRVSGGGDFAGFNGVGLALARGRLSAQAQANGDVIEGRADLHAGDFGFGAVRSADASAAAAFAARAGDRLALNLNGAVTLPQARLTQSGLDFVAGAWPDLGGLPIAPLMQSGEGALVRALSNFSASAPFTLTLQDGVGVFSLPQPFALQARSGAEIAARPLRGDAAMFSLRTADSDLDAAALISVRGGGLPAATIALEDLSGGGDEPIEATGGVAIADWRQGEARLRAEDLNFDYSTTRNGGRLIVTGDALMSGPAAGAILRDLSAPLDLQIDWGGGFRVAPRGGALAARIARIEAPGFIFDNARLTLSPGANGAFVAADALGRMSGGFALNAVALDGRAVGEDANPAHFTARRIEGRFGGAASAMRLDLDIAQPSIDIAMAPERLVRFDAVSARAANFIENGTWRLAGRVEGGALHDPATPATASNMAMDFEARPQGDQAIVTFSNGESDIIALQPEDPEQRALFNPLRVADGQGVMENGAVHLTSRLLVRQGAKPIGTVEATHDFATGAGEAHVRTRDLAFNQGLQPFQISELARGLIENVRGSIDSDVGATWGPDRFETSGRLRIIDTSLSTQTIPIIQGVNGEIQFNDLIALTTPPGQELRVGLVNPGVAAHDGAIRFQLLPQNHIALEDARFTFAQGQLTVQPTEIKIGAEETRFILRLAAVDVATLLSELNTPDLRATGTVEGLFPLLLTSRSAIIENGEVRSAGGGTIAYVGNAGNDMTGPAHLAFEALRSFNYDNLSLTLNGDLSGDVVTAIRFRGRNAEAADLGAIAAGPTGVQLSARGIPFIFNVQVTAPFRRLADTAASITDATSVLNRPVDPPPASPE